jgi:hypothetical protein
MGNAKKLVSARTFVVGVAAVVTATLFACAPTPGTPGTTTTTSTTLPWTEPTGVWTDFTMSCSFTVLGQRFYFDQDASVNVLAPDFVEQGETFFATVAPGPFIVPTNVSGYDLASLKSVVIRFPLGPNVEFVDSVMTAGINMGSGYPSVSVQGTDLLYRVPGPFTPGATVQMPAVRLELTATGTPGNYIEYRMKSFGSVATVSGVDVPTGCTPYAPNPLFFSTLITSAP